MKKICLHGALASKFGAEFKLNVRTPAEAVCALDANFSNFRKEAGEGLYRIAYSKDGECMSRDSIYSISDFKEVHIEPVPSGAGGRRGFAIASIIVGAALIATGVAYPAGVTILGAELSAGSLILQGIGLAISGIFILITPAPGAGEGGESVDQRSSFLSGRPVNSVAQGTPVPVLYGRARVGGHLIASALDVSDV